MSRTPCPHSHTWKMLMTPDWIFGGLGHSWLHGTYSYVILESCVNVQFTSMNKGSHPVHEVLLWGFFWFLTRYLEHRVILDNIEHHYIQFLLHADFQLSSKNRSVSTTSCHQSHTWRKVMVPDCTLGGSGNSWDYGSQFHAIMDMCANCQLSSMNKRVSLSICHHSPTLRILMVPDWSLRKLGHF